MTLKLHNTLTKQIDDFTPQRDHKVTLYTCGPTVYNYLTVGNWVAYIAWDTLVRTLMANGYLPERVMNITDVGHLVSDADEGEDKLEKGAKRDGKTAWEVAEFYAEDFLAGMEKLGLMMPEHITRATDYIPQQLDLVRVLKEKGYTYQIDDGIYYDTSKFPTYANFAGLDLEAQKAGARVEFNDQKRNPSDFALWKFTPAGEKRDMEWETPSDLLDESSAERPGTVQTDDGQGKAEPRTEPYTKYGEGEVQASTQSSAISDDSVAGSAGQQVSAVHSSRMGFPGWHLECSAMAMSILGSTLDIHTGGIDHIPVHHTNEIAQSEAASGKKFANYWLHNNHMKVNGTKISKSLGNGYTLQDLAEHGFEPLDYRMFTLQSHYRSEGNFTFENLEAARNRLKHWRDIAALRHQTNDTLASDSDKNNDVLTTAPNIILEALNDDLNTPEALKVVDDVFSQLENQDLHTIHQDGLVGLLTTIDDVLGLQLQATTPDIDEETKQLILKRQRAREAKDWQASDDLRDKLTKKGIAVRDTSAGPIWSWL